jgi:hypothetical protein
MSAIRTLPPVDPNASAPRRHRRLRAAAGPILAGLTALGLLTLPVLSSTQQRSMRSDGPSGSGSRVGRPNLAPLPAASGGPGAAADNPVPLATPPTPITYWPSAATTGVPVGAVLTNSGSLTLRTDSQVITNLNIVGCVTVTARNVTIQRSRITCNSTLYSIRTLSTAVNLIVTDVEINGQAINSAAVCCDNYTLRRVNVHHVIDGPRLGNNTRIIDSYVHDLSRIPNSHNDTLQITGANNILIQHNNLQPYNPITRDPANACLMMGSTTAPSTNNVLYQLNLCDGGNYSIGLRTDMIATNVVFKNNKYGHDYRYGVVANPTLRGVTWDKPTNVFFDTGLPVVK